MLKVTPRFTECTAQRRTGEFCNLPAAPGMPFPICAHHAIMVFRHLQTTIADVQAGGMEMYPGVALNFFQQMRRTERERAAAKPFAHTVYYLRVGHLIKIGYSSDVAQRLRSYPPDTTLLVTEPGDFDLERQRHKEFNHALVGGREWFEPTPDLMAHIEVLQAATT